MKILKIDNRTNYFEVVPDNLDDLWHLERVIEKGDIVSGKTTRKIKAKEEGEKALRIDMYLDVQAEEIEFHKFSGKLRINGIIVSGKPEELVEIKSHHSLDFEAGEKIKVQKEVLKSYQINRLERARDASGRAKILAIVLDDEIADFVFVKEFGVEMKAKITAEKEGKRYESEKGNYLDKVVKKLEEIKPEKVVVAGPGFTKDKLKEMIEKKNFRFQVFYEVTTSVGVTGINELIKSKKIDKIVCESQLIKETQLVEEALMHLSKDDGLIVYGKQEVQRAATLGAIEKLLVSDETLLENRDEIEKLMDLVERTRGEVHIVSVEHDAGKQLKGFTGLIAILRYKANLS